MSYESYRPGLYHCVTTSASLGVAKTGTPQVVVELRIYAMYQNGPGLVDIDGPGATMYLPLTDKTLGTPSVPGWVYSALLMLGWSGESFTDLSSLVGREADFHCKHEEHEGKMSEKWSLSGPRLAPPTVGDDLARRFGSLMQSARSANAKKPKVDDRGPRGYEGKAKQAVLDTGSDIPF